MTICHRSTPHGLELITDHDPSYLTLTIGLFVSVGSLHDPLEQAGISHLLEHLMYAEVEKCSQHRSHFSQIGAYTNAFTTREYTVYLIKTVPGYYSEALQWILLILSMMQNFSEKFEEEKQAVLKEIESISSNSWERLQAQFYQRCFPDHPIASPVEGKSEDIAKLQSKDVRAFHQKHYQCNRMSLCVISPIQHAQINQDLVSHLEIVTKIRRKPLPTTPHFYSPFVDSNAKNSNYFLLGFATCSYLVEDYWGILLWECYLKYRLDLDFQEKEKTLLEHEILVNSEFYQETGTLCFGFVTSEGERVIQILSELWQNLPKGLGHTDLELIKNRLQLLYLSYSELSEQKIEQLYLRHIQSEKMMQVDDVLQKISRITLFQMNQIFERYLQWGSKSLLCL